MMDDSSNTTPKQQGGVTGKGFVKGDPRINRKGRPKSFDALRTLAQTIAHEEALSGGQPVVIDGHIATVAEMILRSWAASKNPQLVRAFIEIAFGKVPDVHELTGANGGPIRTESNIGIKAVDYRTIASTLAPGPVSDSDTPGEDENTGDGPKVG